MMPRPPPPWTWFIRKMKRKTISAKGSSVASTEPSRLGCGFSELDFSMVPSLIGLVDRVDDPDLLAVDPVGLHLVAAVALDSRSRVALMTWSPSTKVISLTWPEVMNCCISEVVTSSYPPLGVRYCRARRTPTTATTIHSQGPLSKRFTRLFPEGLDRLH